jgi:hypothetical protein
VSVFHQGISAPMALGAPMSEGSSVSPYGLLKSWVCLTLGAKDHH